MVMVTGVRRETGEPKNVASKVKFEVYGEEILNKIVKQSGNCGRVYLPPIWIGKHVKIVLID
jgi:putative transposon-encoded protein